jgi:predicted nuclease with TOPRIM domain
MLHGLRPDKRGSCCLTIVNRYRKGGTDLSNYINMINKANKTLTKKNEELVSENKVLKSSISSLKAEISQLKEEKRMLERRRCKHNRRCESLERTLGSSIAMFAPLVTAMRENTYD